MEGNLFCEKHPEFIGSKCQICFDEAKVIMLDFFDESLSKINEKIENERSLMHKHRENVLSLQEEIRKTKKIKAIVENNKGPKWR